MAVKGRKLTSRTITQASEDSAPNATEWNATTGNQITLHERENLVSFIAEFVGAATAFDYIVVGGDGSNYGQTSKRTITKADLALSAVPYTPSANIIADTEATIHILVTSITGAGGQVKITPTVGSSNVQEL